MHFCKDLLWGSNCTQGCGWCAESCRQLWGKPANSFGNPWYTWSWEHQSLLNYTFVFICRYPKPNAKSWNQSLADKHWRVGRAFSAVQIALKVAVGGCAESCRQLEGKPANSFGTPRRHLRAVQTSARTENRKQLLLRKALSAIHGSLEGKPFAKSCAAQPWPRLAAAAGRAMQRQLAVFAELRSILSLWFSIAVESIFSAQFSGHVCNSPLLAHIFSAVGLSQIGAKSTSPTRTLCKARICSHNSNRRLSSLTTPSSQISSCLSILVLWNINWKKYKKRCKPTNNSSF